MSTVREVTVFAVGDSAKLSTWSNVPYFFTATLISKNIKVNRVDLAPGMIGKALNRTVWRAARLFSKGTTYDYSRSLTYYLDVKRRIKRALALYPDADANIFLTFSFSSAGMGKQPTVLFGDWTYDHLLRHFVSRVPDYLERSALAREDREIESADFVFALFPSVAEYMKRRYQNRNIHYAGNVVNSLLTVEPADILKRKSRSLSLLFIGSKKYHQGALQLLGAYARLKPSFPGLTVNIVGMKEKDFSHLPDGVQCYGYLDKGKDDERDLYYSLLLDARIVVNTTPKWGAFSAMLEAMYFHTPVVVTPYEEFVKTFGSNLKFGLYCQDDSITTLCANIEKLLAEPGYQACCVQAHASVQDYTWSAYIDRLLACINRHSTAEDGAPVSALSL